MTDSNVSHEIEELREQYRAKVFRMMLYVGVIFGGPAIVAFWVGGRLDVHFATGGDTYRLIALAVTFVLSWVWVFRLYAQLNREAKEVERKVREIKQTTKEVE